MLKRNFAVFSYFIQSEESEKTQTLKVIKYYNYEFPVYRWYSFAFISSWMKYDKRIKQFFSDEKLSAQFSLYYGPR